jgi:hypothetical protein
MNFFDTLSVKWQATETIQNFAAYVICQTEHHNLIIRCISGDLFGKLFKSKVAHKNIGIKLMASYTLA